MTLQAERRWFIYNLILRKIGGLLLIFSKYKISKSDKDMNNVQNIIRNTFLYITKIRANNQTQPNWL
jgi:hypothetical protein